MATIGKLDDNVLTVRELIEYLKQCDPDAIVQTEGCDCWGEAGYIEIYEGYILIARNTEG